MNIKTLFSKNSPLWEITNPDYSRYRKCRIAIIFSIIAIVLFLVFIVDDISKNLLADLMLDSVFFIFFCSFPFIVIKIKRPSIWFIVIIFALIVMITRMVISPGESIGGSIIWFFTIPIVSFLLLGTKLGFIPSIISALIIVYLFIVPEHTNFSETLFYRFKFHILLGFSVVTFLSWLYEFDREKLEKTLQSAGKIVNKQKEQLSQANKNLKIMMDETHHRVKNNLAMICSLIYLYQNNDRPKKQVLAELNDKIISIGKIHEMLSKSSTLSLISMKPYLEDITDQLEITYADMNPRIVADVEDISFHPDIAIRIGLIVTELIINACKYGIQSGGEISVMLKKNGNENNLSVENNGKPFPDSVDVNNSGSMGFSIIKSMAEFLGGNLSIKKEQNTHIEINIPGN